MTKIVKSLQKMDDGSLEQVFTQTHAAAVIGLAEYVSGQDILGVSSVNGQTGAAVLNAEDVKASREDHTHDNATDEKAGFMSAEDKKKLDGLTETNGITEERAKELISENHEIILTKVGEVTQ
ncbi:hypothetical protein [Listeria monocytogenes]|uniref:hypothetical protein n=1 Tax=Listeria monocytogenes TaxID=1639 RepID=UPI00190F9DB4|nr:hypothetical protein [Listeria monocytogenes]